MGAGRFIKSLMTAAENESERRLLEAYPTYRTLYEAKGGGETAADGRQRDVWRVTKSLEPLVRDGVPHELAVHQGVYIDPYLWEFTDGGKRPDGTRKLLIRSDGDPDWHKWHQAEYAGTTTNRDSENYNAARMIKRYHDKQYSLRGKGTQCQSGADDLQNIITEGRSTLPPAPIRRVPDILLEKLETQSLSENIRQAKGIGRVYSRHWSSPDPQAMVDDAMYGLGQTARRHNWM